MAKRGERFLNGFESVLWSARLLVLLAVVACLAVFVVVLVLAALDAGSLAAELFTYGRLDSTGRDELRLALTAGSVKVLDSLLLAVMMLIAGMGLYELFISKIELVEQSELASRLLLIRNLDDLKARLASVVLLKLMVKLFQQALAFRYQTAYELLALAACVLVVGVSAFLASRSHPPSGGH